MKEFDGNDLSKDLGLSEAGRTLRLLATLPAPEGLEDRLQAALAAAPRKGRILAWPAAYTASRAWLRGAAAAAIVLVVAGGGWGIYTRVQPAPSAKVIAMPPSVESHGSFASAEAMRRPTTVIGPTVAQPAPVQAPTAKTHKQKHRLHAAISGEPSKPAVAQ